MTTGRVEYQFSNKSRTQKGVGSPAENMGSIKARKILFVGP